MAPLNRGAVIRTSYGTGPYTIVDIDGPCDCPEYLRSLDGDNTPSEPHYHLTCKGIDDPGLYWLNGYRLDGTSVWSDDRILVEQAGAQLELFT